MNIYGEKCQKIKVGNDIYLCIFSESKNIQRNIKWHMSLHLFVCMFCDGESNQTHQADYVLCNFQVSQIKLFE
jgi:hypothetical protein